MKFVCTEFGRSTSHTFAGPIAGGSFAATIAAPDFFQAPSFDSTSCFARSYEMSPANAMAAWSGT